MSTHYVWVRCPAEGCTAYGSVYTGDTELDDFDDADWEGENIFTLCREHKSNPIGVSE